MPGRVEVGPFRFDVVRDQAVIPRDNRGFCDLEFMRIAVAPSIGEERVPATFLHECLHAIVDAAGFRGDLGEEPKALTEEEWVAMVAPGLLLFLRQNPKAVAYLTNRPR